MIIRFRISRSMSGYAEHEVPRQVETQNQPSISLLRGANPFHPSSRLHQRRYHGITHRLRADRRHAFHHDVQRPQTLIQHLAARPFDPLGVLRLIQSVMPRRQLVLSENERQELVYLRDHARQPYVRERSVVLLKIADCQRLHRTAALCGPRDTGLNLKIMSQLVIECRVIGK